MVKFQTDEQTAVAADAATHACAVLRQAFGVTSEDTVRDVFDRAVIREVAQMLWLGVTQSTIAAFEGAAADVHLAMGPDRVRPRGRVVATA